MNVEILNRPGAPGLELLCFANPTVVTVGYPLPCRKNRGTLRRRGLRSFSHDKHLQGFHKGTRSAAIEDIDIDRDLWSQPLLLLLPLAES